ncbi:uncharacterized protein EI97DRAFT_277581 [Westerdykella ornata]|uniref:Uncharacterized protein n=1 Tax=Westerdykella ornata TaxID=318751 RepID=A0A6A6JQD6_WESOR|nr:uncharacterized protein EI97DRAFT_277581 [Westerdykella ornata]KAF2277896.1 hypothetical protein EI97DRAFT_277581 [Westerdykella ornata]
MWYAGEHIRSVDPHAQVTQEASPDCNTPPVGMRRRSAAQHQPLSMENWRFLPRPGGGSWKAVNGKTGRRFCLPFYPKAEGHCRAVCGSLRALRGSSWVREYGNRSGGGWEDWARQVYTSSSSFRPWTADHEDVPPPLIRTSEPIFAVSERFLKSAKSSLRHRTPAMWRGRELYPFRELPATPQPQISLELVGTLEFADPCQSELRHFPSPTRIYKMGRLNRSGSHTTVPD